MAAKVEWQSFDYAMRVVNETMDAYTSGELSEDEAGGRVFHALFDRMMDK